MKRAKIGIVVIIGIMLISMTIYDLLPYRERNYVTHTGSTFRTYELTLNLTTPFLEFEIDPFLDFQDPFPDTISTYHLSDNINVSVLFVSSHDYIHIHSTFIDDYTIETNTTHVSHGVSFSNNSHWCWFFIHENRTEVFMVFSYTANYSIEMIYTRPPKTYVWETVRSFFTTEGVILVGVVLFALVLIYVSSKMVRDS